MRTDKTCLETTRLKLRPHQESDFAAIHAFSSDPEVVKYMQWGPNSEEQTRKFLKLSIANQKVVEKLTYDFVVVEKESGRLVGSITLRLPKPDSKLGEVGYCFNRDSWGKGYASETVQAVMQYGFEKLELHKITATCDPDNAGSAKVLMKCGMLQEGYFKKHIFMKGQWKDTLFFGTTRDDQASNMVEYRAKDAAKV